MTDGEQDRGRLDPDNPEAARQALLDNGFVVLDDVVPVRIVDALREVMERDLDALERQSEVRPPWFAGHLQHQPPFASTHLHADVLASPTIAQLCRAVLGQEIRVVLYTANTNMPGSLRQAVHCDLNQLYPCLEPTPAAPHLLVCNIPLVDCDQQNAIELWPGTHRDPRTHGTDGAHSVIPDDWQDEWRETQAPVQVAQRKGSLLLRDARLWHAGVPNTSGRVRVMVAVGYAPAWYAATPLQLPAEARSVIETFSVPVFADYQGDPGDHLDPVWSGLYGPQMRPAGAGNR
jgi:hypothetical protein